MDDLEYHARLTRLEAQMNLVMQRLGIDPNSAALAGPGDALVSGPSEQVKYLLMQGKKIDAIRVYREQTGTGLKEAKDAVDALERQMRGY